ncbi:crAss001_48 related protein [Herbaspirillum aquaticum]|uniref:crAss001_48 related protein n=1 Tax=Herbaspirillum aquaticum TaxID=568783 RepID=UPI0024DDFE6B|nr:hypothetical protein [Herbaspirillum aquaticum]
MTKQYIGTKIISAKPMNKAEYCAYRGWQVPADEDPNGEGYLVEYHDGGAPNHPDHKGYISWSPKDVFEAAYISIGHVGHFEPWVQRLAGEKAELDGRLSKLDAALANADFLHMQETKRALLMRQSAAMHAYSQILSERLAAAGVGVSGDYSAG